MQQPTIFIFKDEILQIAISNKIRDGLPLLSCRLKEVINGEVSLTFSIPSNHPDSEIVREGCWAVVKDLDNYYRAFVISEETEIHDGDSIVREFWCEDLAVSELNDEIVTDVRPQQTTALDALERLLSNTGSRWQPGKVDSLGISSVNFYYETAMSAIRKIVESWGGEVRFRISMNSKNKITGRYIDILSRLGKKTGKRFEYSKDLVKVERHVDMKNLKTALYGRGRGEENETGDGFGRRYTFADIEWSGANGDPVDKPLGQEWVGDPEALEQWGYWNEDGSRQHRFGVFIWDGGPTEIEDEEQYKRDLLQATWDRLQEINKPLVSYKMSVLDLEYASGGELKHEAVRLGDSVYCIDKHFAYDVQVEARVVEIDRDLLDPANTTLVLGNVISDLSSLIKQLKTDIDKKVSVGDPVSWLQGWKDITNLMFESLGAYVYINNGEGIITTNRPINNIDNPPDWWVQIKGGAMRFANKLKVDGTPDWSLFLTGDGVIADSIMSGTLRTDLVTIGDANQNVKIDRDGVLVKNGLIRVERPDGYPIIIGGRVNMDLEIQGADPPLTSSAVSLFSNNNGVWWETSSSGNPQNCQFYTYQHAARFLVVRAFLFVEPGATAYFSLETGTYAAGNVQVLASTTSTNTDPADEDARAVELKVDLGTPTGNRRSFYARLKSSDPTKKVYARITRKWLEG